jgi:tetratricopeptide (TPR) repeat protein
MDERRPSSEQTVDLSEARIAYQAALFNLDEALPKPPAAPVEVDLADVTLSQALLRALRRLPVALWQAVLAILGIFRNLFRAVSNDLKGRMVRFTQGRHTIVKDSETDSRAVIRDLLLKALWARDYVQDAIERTSSASYVSRSEVLSFVMANEERLQDLGQRALVTGNLDIADLRTSQPRPPDPDRWWWFLNYPGGRFARRMNMVWFVLAIIPALAALVLVTLLAQRLAINGPDLLSGASLVAQVGLGLGGIVAGRELISDLIRRGANTSWQGQVTFALASVFLVVVVLFYYIVPPGAALIYNIFGQQAIRAGNAAEAELYLESAARLDPDPHAAGLMEVGCLYQTLGAPDRAQTVFERALEADSRLLLARYHLAERYSDQAEYAQSLQLLEDGLNLLTDARLRLENGEDSELPGVKTLADADKLQYLLYLARGRAFLENNAPERAQTDLKEAQALFATIEVNVGPIDPDKVDLSCNTEDDLGPFIVTTKLNMDYYLARTWDTICDSEKTANDALRLWREIRNSTPINSRQRGWHDEAKRQLSTGYNCLTNYEPPPDDTADGATDQSGAY